MSDRDTALNLYCEIQDSPRFGTDIIEMALEAAKKSMFEAALDAANSYMTEQYGISALGNPIDRARVKDRLSIPPKPT